MTTRLLLTADAVGGVWTYALDLARALRPLGHEVALAVMGPSPSPEQREQAAAAGAALHDTGLALDWLAADRAEIAAAAEGIARLARVVEADLIQLHAPAPAALADWPVPVVAVAHSCVATWWAAVEGASPLPDDLAWRSALVAEGLAAADAAVAPSAAFAGALQAAYRLPATPLVVHNGRAAMALPPVAQEDAALAVGRLWDRAKDVATLDRAAALLDVPVRAAGSLGAPHGETMALVHAEATDSLPAAALAHRLAARPVFVSTARYEPFGLAVLEAAQAGCALVLSDIPTFRELWNGAATFVPAGDAPGFARAIGDLIADPALRSARGAAARAAAARYTPAAMAEGMAALYRGLLAARSLEAAA